MRSLWSVTYVGAHTATTIKKLQRLLRIQAIDLESERYVFNDKKVERAVFLVEHGACSWAEFILDLIQKTSMLATTWQMSGNEKHQLMVVIGGGDAAGALAQGLPKGLCEVSWVARPDQTYQNRLLSGGSSIERW
jgi:hypothetical protein